MFNKNIFCQDAKLCSKYVVMMLKTSIDPIALKRLVILPSNSIFKIYQPLYVHSFSNNYDMLIGEKCQRNYK